MNLKQEVKLLLDNWYGSLPFKIIHWWEQDNTWFIVVNCKNNLNFIRIFPVGREYQCSMDRVI